MCFMDLVAINSLHYMDIKPQCNSPFQINCFGTFPFALFGL